MLKMCYYTVSTFDLGCSFFRISRPRGHTPLRVALNQRLERGGPVLSNR